MSVDAMNALKLLAMPAMALALTKLLNLPPVAAGASCAVRSDNVAGRISGATLKGVYLDISIKRSLDAYGYTSGYDLEKMNERRTAYIAALKAADQDDIGPLIKFVGPRVSEIR